MLEISSHGEIVPWLQGKIKKIILPFLKKIGKIYKKIAFILKCDYFTILRYLYTLKGYIKGGII